MNEKFVVKMSLSKKVWYDFVNYVNFYRQWWLYAIIIIGVIILQYKATKDFLTIALYLIAILAICYLSNQISSFMLYRKVGKTLKIQFFNNYFLTESEKGRNKIPYSEIKKIVEREKYFYIFLKTARGVQIIEKNSFSLGDKDKFKQFIEDMINKKQDS